MSDGGRNYVDEVLDQATTAQLFEALVRRFEAVVVTGLVSVDGEHTRNWSQINGHPFACLGLCDLAASEIRQALIGEGD